MIDVDALRADVDLVALVSRDVELRARGSEYVGLCPFHDERTPSFTLNPDKGFVHCFGCGAHYDAIGYVMRTRRVSFVDACDALGAGRSQLELLRTARQEQARQRQRAAVGGVWIPLSPVPGEAPTLAGGADCRVWNPKRGHWWPMLPERADAYRRADGALLGYVLRITLRGGAKITPQVTWCIGPDGDARWCAHAFDTPRPLCGLDDLARQPDAPVLIVEGEKCRAAGAGALSGYAVVAWPGGSKGLRYVDWTPLAGRTLVLWPDADVPGRQAMLGYRHYDGRYIDGVAQFAHAVGAASIRYVDTSERPRGWDIADALGIDGWTPRQLAAWAATRVRDIEVVVAQAA